MFRLLVVDATNRIHVLGRNSTEDLVDRFLREVKRTSRMAAGAVPVLCWDHPTATEDRKKALPGYKAGRDPTPAAVEKGIVDALRAAQERYCCWFDEHNESDDLVASVVCAVPDWPVIIHSSDHDMFALLGHGTRLQVTSSTSKSDAITVVSKADVEKKYSIRIEQFLDYKALVGDSSDRVKGVKGIGPKTAVELLAEFGTVEQAVLAGDDLKISAARRQALHDSWNSGEFHNQRSVLKLRDDIPLPLNVQQAIEKAAQLKPSGRFNMRGLEDL